MAPKPKNPSRPHPPANLGVWEDGKTVWYAPALDLPAWVLTTFLMEDGPLYNEDHKHLLDADIAFLWAADENTKQGRIILGQCEEVTFRCGKWQKGRQIQQMVDWFGDVPKFLITLDADFARGCTDNEFCALVEHELYHIGHGKDEFGQLRFQRESGEPVLALRSHDVEEFFGVVRRYGPSPAVKQLVEAASKAPEVSKINIARACGTCMVRAA